MIDDSSVFANRHQALFDFFLAFISRGILAGIGRIAFVEAFLIFYNLFESALDDDQRLADEDQFGGV